MACRREYLSWVVLFLAAASVWRPCSAQASAPAPSADCSTYIAALYPCLDYVLGTNSTPSASCCTGLAQIVSASPLCLCEIVSSAGSSSINVTRALLLPSLCNVTTPALSSCPASSPGSPFSATAPVSSSLSPSTTPALAPTPSTASSPGSPFSATAPVSSSLPPLITPALAPTPSTASSPGSPLSGITPVSSPSKTPALAPTPFTVPSPGSSRPVSAPSPMLPSPVPSAPSTTPILGPVSSPPAPPGSTPAPLGSTPTPPASTPGTPGTTPTPPASTPDNSVGCSASPNMVYAILSMSFVTWKLIMQ